MGPDPPEEGAFSGGDLHPDFAGNGGEEGDQHKGQKRTEKLDQRDDGKERWSESRLRRTEVS